MPRWIAFAAACVFWLAFAWGAGLLTAALLVAFFLINAKREDVPVEAGLPAA